MCTFHLLLTNRKLNLHMALKGNIRRLLNASFNEECESCALDNCDYGLSRISSSVFIFLSIVCGIFAIGGNSALLLALTRTDALRSRVNCSFIFSLALADLMVGLTMTPLYVCYAVRYEPPWLIKLEGFLWILTVTATTYSLSAVSLDRLVSVVYPLLYHQIVTEKRCRVVLCLIWTGAIIFGFPRLVLDDFVKLEKLWIACSVATVAIPLLIMLLSYTKILLIVQKTNRSVADQSVSRACVSVGNKKAVITIGIIVILFILTFIPTTVVYFMLLFEEDLCKELTLNDVWLWVALVSFSHSSFNPWVYGLRYRELRQALKDSLKCE